MARKPRVHFDGALYHVICRGNQGQRLFRDDTDRRRYMGLLQESPKRFGCQLYAYVLMDNHLHHLIEVGATSLSKIMQNILFRYTRYWNKRYRKIGHLFQGRYKAILCEKESYLLELIRYIHLNPVRSKMVSDPSQYAWSSHGAYIKGKGLEWLAVEAVLPRWGRRRSEAIAAYQRFVQAGLGDGHCEDYYDLVDQRFLGDEAFLDDVVRKAQEVELPREVEIKWEEICETILNQFKITSDVIFSKGRTREVVRIKRIMAWVGREVGGLTNQEMAKTLGQDSGGLSRGLRQIAVELKQDERLQRTVQTVCVALRRGRKFKKSISHA